MADLLFYLVAGVVMVLSVLFLKRRNRQAAEARMPERKSDAARFGWEFEVDQTMVFEILRWRGTTAGVTWVAESLRTGRDRRTLNRSVTRITRWWARRRVDVPGAIVMLTNEGDEQSPLLALNEIDADSVGGRLVGTVLGSAFEVAFGELGHGIDAKALTVVDGLASRYPDYTILATDVDAASAFLFQRLERLVANGGGSSIAIETKGLSILITPDGLALNRAELVFTAEDLSPLVNTGVGLATALSVSR